MAVRRFAARLVHSLALLVGVSMLSFVLSEIAPGDVFDDLALDPRISTQSLQESRARLGLDRSLPRRYLDWTSSVLRGEFGYSLIRRGPVGPLLWPRVANTLILAGCATAVAWLLALPLGVWSAARHGGWVDRAGLGATSALLAIPDILLGLGALYLALRTGWFPTGGMVSVGAESLGFWRRAIDVGWHLALPATALALAAFPVLLRHVRAALLEVLESPFLQRARGQGVPSGRLFYLHALRAAANPLVSLFGLSVAGLLSGSLLIEEIMSWPGLGPLLLDAILARDVHLVIGAVMLSCALLIVGNLLADLLLYWIDPRVRAG